MIQAMWQNTVIAKTKAFETVEGNRYFPLSSLDMQYFQHSSTQSNCPWKGLASYYNVVVDDEVIKDAAWCLVLPNSEASSGQHSGSRGVLAWRSGGGSAGRLDVHSQPDAGELPASPSLKKVAVCGPAVACWCGH